MWLSDRERRERTESRPSYPQSGKPAAENRERRYQITPDDYRKAEEHAQANDLDIVGFYHSHPDHPARPSQTDLAEATFPGYTYVIISVNDGAPEELTAWSLATDRSQFNHEDITLTTTA